MHDSSLFNLPCWLHQQSVNNPKGLVLVVENQIPIGQLELTVKEYEGKEMDYVNLYYLIPEKPREGFRFPVTRLYS
jgi:hypothetical protein